MARDGQDPEAARSNRESWTHLLDALSHTALTYPERGVHVVDERGRQEFRTWAQILERSRRVGTALRNRGIGRSERILFVFPTSFEFLSAFFGALSIGAIPVPLAPPRPTVASESEIAEYFRRTAERLDANSLLFGTGIDRACRPPEVGRVKMVTDYAALLDHVSTVANTVIPDELPEVAYLQMTSGATGNANAVAIGHANILTNLEAVGNAVGVTEDDVGVSWLPNYTIMGLVGVVCFTLYWSLDVICLDPERFLKRPDEWLWAFDRHRGTLSVAPSFSYQYCVRRVQESQLQDLDLASWRIAMNGGEPVRVEHMQEFGRRFGQYGLRPDLFMPVYGLTEATLGVTFAELQQPPSLDTVSREDLEMKGLARHVDRSTASRHSAAQFVGVGQPLDGIEVEIRDDEGEPLSERQLGEVAARGPNIALGYVGITGDRSTPNTRFDGAWVMTGDLGYLADGELFVVGRAADVVRHVDRRRIFPEELEFEVNGVDGVRTGSAAVFGVPGPGADTRDRLIVGFEAQDGADEVELAELVRSAIMRHFAVDPDEVIVLTPKSVPRSASGKVRRHVARKLYLRGELDRRARRSEIDRVRRTILRAQQSALKFGRLLVDRTTGLFISDDS